MAGFIHDKLDVKLLILYLTSRLAGPVDLSDLVRLTLCDDGVNYFFSTEAITELVESGHLTLENGLYTITEKGLRNISSTESSLSPVILKRCDERLTPINYAILRGKQVKSSLIQNRSREWMVQLALNDDADNIMSLSLLMPSQETGRTVADQFRNHSASMFNEILSVFADHRPFSCEEHRDDLSAETAQYYEERLSFLDNPENPEASVRTEITPSGEDSWGISLSLKQGSVLVFSLFLLIPSEERGQAIAHCFQSRPTAVILEILQGILDCVT